MTKTGHRQQYTWVRFVAINIGDKLIGEVANESQKVGVAEAKPSEAPVSAVAEGN